MIPTHFSFCRTLGAAVLTLSFCLGLMAPYRVGAAPAAEVLKPPVAPERPVTDQYFDVQVTDPYRWMESAGPEFITFLHAEQEATDAALVPLRDLREAFRQRITALINVAPFVAAPKLRANRYFYLALDPNKDGLLLMTRPINGGKPTLLIDPGTMNANGQHANIDSFEPSWDGKHVVVGIALGGSEMATLHVLETATGHLLSEVIPRAQYAHVSWTADSTGFYYSQLQELPPGAPPAAIYENQRVHLHKLGDTVTADAVVFGPGVDPAVELPKAGFVEVSTDPSTSLVLASQSRGTVDTAAAWVRDTAQPASKWRQVIAHEDGVTSFAFGLGGDQTADRIYAIAKHGAPNGRVVCFDPQTDTLSNAREVLPAGDLVLTTPEDGLVTAREGVYLHGVRDGLGTLVKIPYGEGAKPSELALPLRGSLSDLDACTQEDGVTFDMASWVQPDLIYRLDPATGQSSDTKLVPLPPLDLSAYTAEEVEARSADGTMVPLSIIHRKDLQRDGKNPTYVHAYGGYGFRTAPGFGSTRIAWLERGGVLAYAHVRGGGEKGETWHLAAQKLTKQKTVDDYAACVRYLEEGGYTSPEHLAAEGTSAGGIAVGGLLVQHPELLRAAVDNVGVTDLLRFETTQGGDANVPELGSVKVEGEFRALYALSPYAHVERGVAYPAVLLTTGINDPRVPPWMVAKMAARLQADTSSGRPILLSVNFDKGHGGNSKAQVVEDLALQYSFLAAQLGMASTAGGIASPD